MEQTTSFTTLREHDVADQLRDRGASSGAAWPAAPSDDAQLCLVPHVGPRAPPFLSLRPPATQIVPPGHDQHAWTSRRRQKRPAGHGHRRDMSEALFPASSRRRWKREETLAPSRDEGLAPMEGVSCTTLCASTVAIQSGSTWPFRQRHMYPTRPRPSKGRLPKQPKLSDHSGRFSGDMNRDRSTSRRSTASPARRTNLRTAQCGLPSTSDYATAWKQFGPTPTNRNVPPLASTCRRDAISTPAPTESIVDTARKSRLNSSAPANASRMAIFSS
jgi:hypothetical protein